MAPRAPTDLPAENRAVKNEAEAATIEVAGEPSAKAAAESKLEPASPPAAEPFGDKAAESVSSSTGQHQETQAIGTSSQHEGNNKSGRMSPKAQDGIGYGALASAFTPSQINSEIKFLDLEIKHLESRKSALKELESQKNEAGGTSPKPEGGEDDVEEDHIANVHAIPEIRRLDWYNFKNTQYCDCEKFRKWVKEEKAKIRPPAIEVLVGKPRYFWQKRTDEWELKYSDSAKTVQSEAEPRLKEDFESSTCPKEMPERIRINSKPLLTFLTELGCVGGADWSRVILRPYKPLVHFQEEIRRHYEALLRKWSPSTSSNPGNRQDSTLSGNGDEPKQNRKETERRSKTKDLTDSLEALEDFKCLIDFIDQEVRPTDEAYRGTSCQKVRFSDLWHLYHPGDYVMGAPRRDSDPTKGQKSDAPTSQSIKSDEQYPLWRVLQVTGGRNFLRSDGAQTENMNQTFSQRQQMSKFRMRLYRIDFDGDSFWPTWTSDAILPFKNERNIKSLDFVPLRFVENSESVRENLIELGRKFMQYRVPQHRMYDGLTVTRYHSTEQCLAAPKQPEHIRGDVMVDFKETARDDKNWVLSPETPPQLICDDREIDEAYDLKVWRDSERTDLNCSEEEVVEDDSRFDEARMDAFISRDGFLSSFWDRTSDDDVNGETFGDDDFVLLPKHVCAFIFYRRSFALLRLDHLKPVEIEEQGWKDLKLVQGHKEMLLAQAKSHFRDKQHPASERTAYQDLVSGKGQGLTVLLHGAPGVGKTSTAECIARKLKQPLYPITCGDLGTTAVEVDKELENIFSRAQKWGCVLLLDEADVFLAERSRYDVKRNALVSVFLRTLEYYNGLLFLTTNRVGLIDPAFKSRIHLPLYYPPLKARQTQAIWKVNLSRLIEHRKNQLVVDSDAILDFAEVLWDRWDLRWNGRQIRNVFQTAAALAEYEADREGTDFSGDGRDLPVQLTADHFKKVVEATRAFDDYLSATHGQTESDRAFTNAQRADRWAETPEPAQGAHIWGSNSESPSWNMSASRPSIPPHSRSTPTRTHGSSRLPHEDRPVSRTAIPYDRGERETPPRNRYRDSQSPFENQQQAVNRQPDALGGRRNRNAALDEDDDY